MGPYPTCQRPSSCSISATASPAYPSAPAARPRAVSPPRGRRTPPAGPDRPLRREARIVSSSLSPSRKAPAAAADGPAPIVSARPSLPQPVTVAPVTVALGRRPPALHPGSYLICLEAGHGSAAACGGGRRWRHGRQKRAGTGDSPQRGGPGRSSRPRCRRRAGTTAPGATSGALRPPPSPARTCCAAPTRDATPAGRRTASRRVRLFEPRRPRRGRGRRARGGIAAGVHGASGHAT